MREQAKTEAFRLQGAHGIGLGLTGNSFFLLCLPDTQRPPANTGAADTVRCRNKTMHLNVKAPLSQTCACMVP